jgi:hypothetical protein
MIPPKHMSRRLIGAALSMTLFAAQPSLAQQGGAKEVIDAGPAWNGYDGYVQKMLQTIQAKWQRILVESKSSPPPGTLVAIKFILSSDGKIERILDVGNTSNDPGEQSCLTALATTAPFNKWTDKMVADLGTSQTLTLRFYY